MDRRQFALAGTALAASAAGVMASDPALATFAKRLAHKRRKAGLSIEQAASSAGLAADNWQRWERGECYPTDDEAWEMAALPMSNCSSRWLLAGGAGFVARLRSSRERAGLTIHEAAARINASAADWQAWESDLDVPPLDVGLNVANLLGVETEWLAVGRLRA